MEITAHIRGSLPAVVTIGLPFTPQAVVRTCCEIVVLTARTVSEAVLSSGHVHRVLVQDGSLRGV